MGEIIKFRGERTPETLNDLLVEAANSHILIPRLRAEADKKYLVDPNDPNLVPDPVMHKYLMNYYDLLENYITNSTILLNDLEDDRVYFGITGCQSLSEMERRHSRLGQRIEVARKTGNVVSFMKYKRSEPLKGA